MLAMDGGGVGCRRLPGEFSNTCIVERIEHLWPEVITNPRSDAGLSDMVDHDCEAVAGLFLYGRHRKGRAKSSALAGRATKGGCSTMMLMEPPPSSRRAWCIRAFTVSWNQQRSTPTGRGAVGVHRDFRRGRSGHDQPRDFKGFPRTMSTGVCERHTCGESWGRVGAGRKSEHGEWTLPFHPRAASPT